MNTDLQYDLPNEYTSHEHFQHTVLTSSISSSPPISNSSSAASSASTLPVDADQQIDDESLTESTAVTPVEQIDNESRKKKTNPGDTTSVQVAVRIRPQSIRERVEMCKICTNVTLNEPQITLGYKDDKSFTYDFVYDFGSKQDKIFNESVLSLVDGCLNGYNATVLAYGQTGSGKTYTMGTSFDEIVLNNEEQGILPRAILHLFNEIEKINQCQADNSREISVNAQFIELYNEEIIDLIDSNSSQQTVSQLIQFNETLQDYMTSNYASATTVTASTTSTYRPKIEIHEDQFGGIFLNGVSSKNVTSVEETLQILKNGAKVRSTGSTNMNSQSSRSHAIFTLIIKSQLKNLSKNTGNQQQEECQSLSAKFHFVDLAGSERLKRTGATGSRAKEGICINRGLLALGNVISALGDREKLGCHVPYRDSKLTRLLQDSLGGNSRTLMIACISPSDRDFMETLNTLRYANRARNIKNKVSINQDKTSQRIGKLLEEIERLNYELAKYKTKNVNPVNMEVSMLRESSRTASSCTIVGLQGASLEEIIDYKNLPEEYAVMINKLKEENSLLLADNQSLRMKSKAMHETLESFKIRNCELEMKNINGGHESSCNDIKNYLIQIEDLRCKLVESEYVCKYLKQNQNHHVHHSRSNSSKSKNKANIEFEIETSKTAFNLLNDAKKEVEQNTRHLKKLKKINSEYTIENQNHIKPSDQEDSLTGEEEEQEEDETNSTCDNTNSSNEIIANYDDSCRDSALSLVKSNDEYQERLEAEIENLGVEIDIKKRLISELESNKKNLDKMKDFYENKLNTLSTRIRLIEEERERLIANMSENDTSKYDEQVRRIRTDYELKIQALQSEVNKYQRIKLKNAEMLKNNLNTEKELVQLNKEVLDMKRLKVKLINQLKDEAIRFKREEQNRIREIATLKREHLKKDSQIKVLESEKKCKEVILKRKQEQLQALRRNTTRLSDKASGKNLQASSSVRSVNEVVVKNTVFNSDTKNSNGPEMTIFKKKGLFSKSFNVKWQKLDQIIHGLILKKQAISLIEREMERFLEQREKISRKLNRLTDRLKRRIAATDYIFEPIERRNDSLPTEIDVANTKIDELKDRIDVMKSNVDYLQDQIAECQTNIIQLDELKDGNDYVNLESFIETITTLNESKYFIKKLLVLALNKGINAAKKEYLCNELKCELDQFERDYNTQQDLLKTILNNNYNGESNDSVKNNSFDQPFNQLFKDCFDNYFKSQNNNIKNEKNNFENFEIDEIILAPQLEDSSTESEDEDYTPTGIKQQSRRLSTNTDLLPSVSINLDTSIKVRQLVSKPQDLLYCHYAALENTNNIPPTTPIGTTPHISHTTHNKEDNLKEISTNTLMNSSEFTLASRRICSRSYTKIPDLKQQDFENGNGCGKEKDEKTPTTTVITTTNRESNLNLNSIPMSKSVIVTASDSSNYKRMTRSTISRQTSKDSFRSTSPSRSPVTSRRFIIRNENVFNRLTSESKQSPMPERGNVRQYSGNTNRFRSSPITLSHVAEGHSKAILSVDSFEYKLFTGSKDRTAKIWDLTTGQELAALTGHSNNVTKVQYDQNTRLYFTVSSSYVKIWDLRESSAKCIKNLCSSGAVYEGNAALSIMKSSVKVLQQNEVNQSTPETLINDLCLDENGNYLYLATGNTVKIWDLKQFAEIAKLSGGQKSSIMTMLINNNQIITGSKDHYIRVFDLSHNLNLNSYSSSYLNNSDIGSSSPSNQSENSLNGGVSVSKYNMMPPHYDGVQTLCRIDDSLFSGSRDMCIKKWSMADNQCKQSINNAHRDWICSLDYLREYHSKILLSGCRGGYLKMWNVETLEKISDFRAHLCPINAIKVNGNMLFTASDDATVRIWRKDYK